MGSDWSDCTSECMFDLEQGDYLFSCKVYSPNSSGRIYIFIDESDSDMVEFNSSENVQSISLAVSNHLVRGIRVLVGTLDKVVYFDDFSVIPQ